MQSIQFIQITPEELKNEILTGIKEQLEELKKEYKPKEPSKYLTRNEVAQMLSVDLSTLWNWSKKGKLTPYGIGNRVYYKREDIDKAIIQLNK